MRTLLTCLVLTASVQAQADEPKTGHSLKVDGPQVRIEVRFLTASPKLLSSLKTADQVRTVEYDNALTVPNIPEAALLESDGIQISTASYRIQEQAPVFVRTISDDEVRSMTVAVQQSGSGNILCAPKVVMGDGQDSEIKDITTRSFTVRHASAEQGQQTQTQAVHEGTRIGLRARLRDQAIRLDVALRLAKLDNVRTLELSPDSQPLEVPSVALSEIQLSALVPRGETLAICGLQTRPQADRAVAGVPLVRKVAYASRLFQAERVEPTELVILIRAEEIK